MPKSRLLNEVIAILKGVKARVASRCTELHRILQKGELLSGIAREYNSKLDNGDRLPPEHKKVQAIGSDQLTEMAKLTAELFDATAALDYANCNAKADIVIGGNVIVKDAPATYLIFVEKQLVDLHTTLSKMLTLDDAVDWNEDTNTRGLYRTQPVESARTKKVEEFVVVVPVTEHHPAQIAKVTKDVIEGYWTQTQLSGAIPDKTKKSLLERIDRLIDATKEARERANMTEAPAIAVGRQVMDYVFQN